MSTSSNVARWGPARTAAPAGKSRTARTDAAPRTRSSATTCSSRTGSCRARYASRRTSVASPTLRSSHQKTSYFFRARRAATPRGRTRRRPRNAAGRTDPFSPVPKPVTSRKAAPTRAAKRWAGRSGRGSLPCGPRSQNGAPSNRRANRTRHARTGLNRRAATSLNRATSPRPPARPATPVSATARRTTRHGTSGWAEAVSSSGSSSRPLFVGQGAGTGRRLRVLFCYDRDTAPPDEKVGPPRRQVGVVEFRPVPRPGPAPATGHLAPRPVAPVAPPGERLRGRVAGLAGGGVTGLGQAAQRPRKPPEGQARPHRATPTHASRMEDNKPRPPPRRKGEVAGQAGRGTAPLDAERPRPCLAPVGTEGETPLGHPRTVARRDRPIPSAPPPETHVDPRGRTVPGCRRVFFDLACRVL